MQKPVQANKAGSSQAVPMTATDVLASHVLTKELAFLEKIQKEKNTHRAKLSPKRSKPNRV